MATKKILSVEDSKYFGTIIKETLEATGDYEVIWLQSLKETSEYLQNNNNDFMAALLDFNLPDATEGEIIDTVFAYKIPIIIFTSNVSEKIRNFVWSKSVVDYILKDDPHSLNYVIDSFKRIERNKNIKIIIVDPSREYLELISNLLKIHLYQVLTTDNGETALKILNDNPETKLIITEFDMDKMDGFKLTQKIREKYSRDILAIIGFSNQNNQFMGARFLKYGANDFINKNFFVTEDFYSRINLNIENIDNLNFIKEASVIDFLTGLYNRRYFYEFGQKLFASSERNQIFIACAMIDIDHFKDINDTYGHEFGDIALKHIAKLIKDRMRRTDIVTRFGGEEFCILTVNANNENIEMIFEDLRKTIENSIITLNEHIKKTITVSIGVYSGKADTLEKMVKLADDLLYKAKLSGRNKTVVKIT